MGQHAADHSIGSLALVFLLRFPPQSLIEAVLVRGIVPTLMMRPEPTPLAKNGTPCA
jgi:hypothetical protein